MNFLLSDTQREIQDTIRRLLAQRCDSRRLHAMFDGDGAHDAALWQALAAVGALSLHLPEAHGGAGLGLLDAALIAEVLGEAAAPVPFLGHVVATTALALAGSDEQRNRWLPKLASGEAIATVAFEEEGARWDPAEWQLACDGTSITGSKRSVEAAGIADVVVVGGRDGALALVERPAAGLEAQPLDGIDRTRRLWNLSFVRTPADALPGATPAIAERLRDAALILVAADAFGGAARAVTQSVEYAKTRHQFGVPIGQFQALKHQLAEMAVAVEPSRGLYWFAAHAWDDIPAQASAAAALAKSHLCERFLQAARDAIEAHGGIGYTWAYDTQILLKRAMYDFAMFGIPATHRARYADLARW
ncbi:MAG TPA: acyl-CoA dehydrogenase family protein [Nevskiaceae bacterium]|nr:acyl-CoA dehydrogenase family protein [Nevskiaceae bacterium]